MKYTVQRPLTVWVEVVVDEADSVDGALEKAEKMFVEGDYIELHDTFEIDYYRHWVQDEKGEISHV
jgi:predicted metal-dependent hydrolase